MILALVLAGSVLLCAFLVAGLVELATVAQRRRDLVRALESEDDTTFAHRLTRWDRSFRRTRPGHWVERQLVLAGEEHRRPLVVVAVAVAGGLALGWVLAVTLAPAFGAVGLVAIVIGTRWYLDRGRERRREQFVAQMPELARVLSNATSAGLSITGAIGVAASELAAPAGAELARVSSRLRFGAGLEDAMKELEERLPSREVAVLVSTLLVSARSGGSLVTALRDIADTLEERKEVRREIRTTLAESTSTGYLVILLGFGLLFLLNTIQPGTVQAMTTHWVGQLALLVSGSMFAGGFLLIRRMTRLEP
ncbi:type II secretion protein F [Xylanimonas allomyrinae]|uniref:Type II secretion protein F n=1 Tax=Xylanimonas allomyrinae TaxID=2509459 RepID=A0A4P6ELF0_9MICO|nr:type II secretion system F family protein [Xylanimonas allomyrinae]QAY63494.1 type II secretion protein F [Xylanimonas allomyrinae]